MNKIKQINIFMVLVVLISLTRLIPHPPNFTPIISISILSGMFFGRKFYAFGIPIISFLIADYYLGFYNISIWVYSALFMIIYSSSVLNFNLNLKGVILSSCFGSFLFFIITNFGVFILGYPHSIEGFIACYTLAIPFFHNTLISTLLYSITIYSLYNSSKSKAVLHWLAKN